MNEKKTAEEKYIKIYANGIFNIKIPVARKDIPEEELKYLDSERIVKHRKGHLSR